MDECSSGDPPVADGGDLSRVGPGPAALVRAPVIVSGGPVLAGGAVVATLVVGIAAVAGSLDSTYGQAAMGLATGLRAGTVPAAYLQAVTTAGTRCAEAPAPLIAAQLEAESGWNPGAVSPVGAQGMAQFMPGTWATWGLDANSDGSADPFDPFDAIASLAAYDCALADQLRSAVTLGQIHGDLTQLMLAAYNAGPAAVEQYHAIPPYAETTTYVQTITDRAVYFGALSPAVATSPLGARIVAAATAQLGVPYLWGGTTPAGFDCSGLVLYAVAQASGDTLAMPRLADTQTRVGTPVATDQLQPGDLISFTDPGATVAHHIGIYIGNDRMIHSPETGSAVSYATLSDPYWKNQQWRAVRIG